MFRDLAIARQDDRPHLTPAVAVVGLRTGSDGALAVRMRRWDRAHGLFPGAWTLPVNPLVASETRETDDAARAHADAARAHAMLRELGIDERETASPIEIGSWLTPEQGPVCWRIHVYAADVGSAAAGADDARAVWVAPREALARWQRGEWLIPPWTREVLAPLAGRAGDALARLAEHGAEHAPLARLHELVPGVSVMALRTPTLPPATHTNCYVVGTRGFAVIDPASPYPDEQAALADALAARVARGDRPIAVLLTHHHDDHIGGAAAVAGHLGVGVWAHERTADRVRGRLDIARTLADGDVVALNARDDLVQPVASTAEVEPRRLRAVFTPGHAPGHLCFLDERSRFLVAGDMVAGVGTIVVEPSDGDMRAYLASLARMKALAPSAIGPAHGPAIGDPEALLDHYVAHRLWREARVLAALKAHGPARPDALVRHAYADVPVAIHPLAERSLIAHLIKLDGDGLAAVDGDVWRVI